MSFLPSFEIDMNAWLGWANRLAQVGPTGFYSDAVWTQYTPGFLYWLWAMGKLGLTNPLAVKIPIMVADIVLGLLIYKIVSPKSKRWGLAAFGLYALNPAILFNGSVWGQIDGILALFLFLAVYLLVERKVVLSSLSWAAAFLIKPQAIAVVPLLILLMAKKFPAKKWLIWGSTAVAAILVLALPFFPSDPFLGLPELISKMGEYYAYTSVFAFNLWSLVGMWKADSMVFLGLPYVAWGAVAFGLSVLFIFLKFRAKLNEKGFVYLVASLLFLAFFLFPTRVHERYLFPALAFLITAAGVLKDKKLLAGFVVVSFLFLLNLYHPYAYYNTNFLVSQNLLTLTGELTKVTAAGLLAIFFLLIFFDRYRPPIVVFTKKALWAIILFAAITRLIGLASPKQEYFDEVYHAFTAKVILHGERQAWEWWNTPPEGFAYEWTHPPLAKLLMVGGMLLLGENSVGWRAPAALFGVGAVYLVYKLAHEISKDDQIAVVSAAVFALDGLPLVMSRIGMNDIYFLFFALACLYSFIKDRNLVSAIFFGLAAASKWTAAWLVPVVGLSFFVFKKKVKPSLLWFAVLPMAVYLASYLPMFVSGHTWSQFVEMQKQMWWYHTGLTATHSYQSAAVSWPFMLRPVWLYTLGRQGSMTANIYAAGNPFIFWPGLVAVGLALVWAFRERNRKLAFVAFSYLAFFVPWIGSPRIMFLYHYLPSLPFLAIATGYALRRLPRFLFVYLFIGLLVFIYFFPHWTGIKIPIWLDNSYYWFSSWK